MYFHFTHHYNIKHAPLKSFPPTLSYMYFCHHFFCRCHFCQTCHFILWGPGRVQYLCLVVTDQVLKKPLIFWVTFQQYAKPHPEMPVIMSRPSLIGYVSTKEGLDVAPESCKWSQTLASILTCFLQTDNVMACHVKLVRQQKIWQSVFGYASLLQTSPCNDITHHASHWTMCPPVCALTNDCPAVLPREVWQVQCCSHGDSGCWALPRLCVGRVWMRMTSLRETGEKQHLQFLCLFFCSWREHQILFGGRCKTKDDISVWN